MNGDKPVTTNWRPIETAPHDGTHVLVWVKANPELGHPANYSHAVDAYWTPHNKGGWVWHGVAGNITHWMPLPEGPND